MPTPDSSDDFIRIGGPDEWPRFGVVLFEESINGGLQVDDGVEDAAFEPALGELGEEALDGVEPGAGSRRKMEAPARMSAKPRPNFRVLVGGVVVEDDVNELSGRNLGLDGVQEADKLLMAMALHIAADDGSVEDVERGEQRRRAIAFVVMGHRAGAAFLQGQTGLCAVERLDLALLIDRQHDGVRRRIDIEPDDIAQFVDELRIVRKLELPDPMRLKAMGAPDALDRADGNADLFRHHGGGPVRRLGGRIGQGCRHHALNDLQAERRYARRPRLVPQEAVDALGHEPLLPAPDTGLGFARPTHDLDGPGAIGCRQNDPGPPNMFLGAVPVRDDRFQPDPLRGADLDGDAFAHADRLARRQHFGNPLSDFIH